MFSVHDLIHKNYGWPDKLNYKPNLPGNLFFLQIMFLERMYFDKLSTMIQSEFVAQTCQQFVKQKVRSHNILA